MRHIHVIPVRPGHTPEQTWAELIIMGELDPPCPVDCDWADIECDGEECARVARVRV